ncbi:MAG: TlpA family protein disulfide reductase [Treponema sp.]|nr:TlpA family protein disulfide reductase [Treponema sp.]
MAGSIIAISLGIALLLYYTSQASAQVSSETERTLRDAGISILKERRNPIDFSLPLLTGGNASLSSYRGKVVLLNFWATWCPPCRAEMPSMEVLYQRLKNQGLEILAVDLGEDTATVQQFIRNNPYTFPVLLDRNNRIGSQYGARSIPTTFVIDREGKIIGGVVGAIRWDEPKLIAAFDAVLKSR